MGYINPSSGGLYVILSAMKHLKQSGFDVYTFYCFKENEIAFKETPFGKEFKDLNVDELNPETDLVIISEEFVWVVLQILNPKKIRYMIFNQGISASFYSQHPDSTPVSLEEYKIVYKNAIRIISNSLHTTKGLITLFEIDPQNIFQYRIGIDRNLYYPEKKENLVCFLLSKNSDFGRFIEIYFKGKYPEWDIVRIDRFSKEETASIFRKSKIFLSFGGPEGFGLPPLEAAISGCRVIGFDGCGGREYFKEPTFTKVKFMDHLDFIEKLEIFMKSFDYINITPYNDYIDYLSSFYSKENEMISVLNIFDDINI